MNFDMEKDANCTGKGSNRTELSGVERNLLTSVNAVNICDLEQEVGRCREFDEGF